ncbi:MAG TPA: HD domain-containing protein, partial [Nitrospirae bacterium]|nr:HD domain-containing protein [Nitrospirota bacterium]
TRVRYSVEFLLNFDYLMKEFKDRGLGTVRFKGIISPVDVQRLIRAFIGCLKADDRFDAMSELMQDSRNIDIERLRHVTEEGDSDIRKVVKRTYFNAVSFSKGIISKIKSGEKISMKRSKRVVESMVDMLLEEEQLLMGMTAIKDYDDYTYHHSVNVSILAIALGHKLALGKKAVTELGLVALFHDLGKMNVPPDVLNKPSSFTEQEWAIVKKHPFWGAKAALKLKGLDNTSIKAAVVAFEHHLNYNLKGYPVARFTKELDFYSRIVTICDQYDAMTSARVYSRTPLRPDKALSVMVDRSGNMLDPVLLKVFINMVGVYPIGTLVFLKSREMGLVHEANPLYGNRPRVLVIVNSQGKKVKGYVLDLSEKDQSGNFVRSIYKTLDPNKYNINLAEYLL